LLDFPGLGRQKNFLPSSNLWALSLTSASMFRLIAFWMFFLNLAISWNHRYSKW